MCLICWVKNIMSTVTRREKVASSNDGLIEGLKGSGKKGYGGWWWCGGTRQRKKVTGGGCHQNANVVWDIYCRVLMQFKTGSLSCSPSPGPCWALINQPLKADVTWIALHTACSGCSVSTRKRLKNLWRCPLMMVDPEEIQIKDVCDVAIKIKKGNNYDSER